MKSTLAICGALLVVVTAGSAGAQTSTTTGSGSSTYDNTNTTTGQSLPSTASPLPLLYVSAIGTLTTGYWLARRRRG